MTTPPPHLLPECIRIVNRAFLGLLTTVDENGAPHARWMGTATTADGLHKIYTLTARGSRKLEHVARQPRVCWVFSDTEYTDIVTLHGRAVVHTSPLATQQVWDRLQDFARTWCMNALSHKDNLELVVIETDVEAVEYMSPRLQMYQPVQVPMTPAAQG